MVRAYPIRVQRISKVAINFSIKTMQVLVSCQQIKLGSERTQLSTSQITKSLRVWQSTRRPCSSRLTQSKVGLWYPISLSTNRCNTSRPHERWQLGQVRENAIALLRSLKSLYKWISSTLFTIKWTQIGLLILREQQTALLLLEATLTVRLSPQRA